MPSDAGSIDERLQQIWHDSAQKRMPLPTELELATALGASRPMVREALVRMEADGLIARRAHQGTFPNVSALSIPFRIDQSYELTARLTDSGLDVSVDVVSGEWSTLTADEAHDLQLEEGASCFRVVKRWCADGEPLILAEDVVPARRRDDVDFPDDYSVFDIVDRLRGAVVEWESASLRPVLPSPSDQELLSVGDREPLLAITLVGVSLHGDRLFRAYELHTSRGPEYGMVRRAPAHVRQR
jgi:GntR family transcriptional regulator